MVDEMNTCTYSPQISQGNSRIAPMSASQKAITPRSTIQLRYPFGGPDIDAFFLTLRNPNLNNKLVPKISRIQRYSRGDELIIYRNPDWTKATVINWAFEGLTASEAEGCLEFCSESLGQPVRLIDYESRLMIGIIMNPNNPISQEKPDSKNSDCFARAYTWKFDFQGVYQ